MAAKSLAVSTEFATPICLMFLMKQIAMHAESTMKFLHVIPYILDMKICFE